MLFSVENRNTKTGGVLWCRLLSTIQMTTGYFYDCVMLANYILNLKSTLDFMLHHTIHMHFILKESLKIFRYDSNSRPHPCEVHAGILYFLMITSKNHSAPVFLLSKQILSPAKSMRAESQSGVAKNNFMCD